MDQEKSLLPVDGLRVGSLTTTWKIIKAKDRGTNKFWASFDDIVTVCKSKASWKTWSKKIINEFSATGSPTTISEIRAKTALENFFFSPYGEALFFHSSEVSVQHRRCITKEQLIEEIKDCHARNHQQFNACYESLRSQICPVACDTVQLLFKENVKCNQCFKQTPI